MKKQKRQKIKNPYSNKNTIQKIWYFIWHDDSTLSWIINIILAFIIVKFIFYPGISMMMGTELPLVAVISPSMEHRVTSSAQTICGQRTQETGNLNVETWWNICGEWYEENTNLTLQDFKEFPLRNGFNKGDIIMIRSKKNIEVGDVIVFHSGKPYPIIHRIIEINETNIITKGDNNPGLIRDRELNEEQIEHEYVIGKAYAKIPYLGYIKIWFTNFLELFIK